LRTINTAYLNIACKKIYPSFHKQKIPIDILCFVDFSTSLDCPKAKLINNTNGISKSFFISSIYPEESIWSVLPLFYNYFWKWKAKELIFYYSKSKMIITSIFKIKCSCIG
jgi:hypothetical protein